MQHTGVTAARREANLDFPDSLRSPSSKQSHSEKVRMLVIPRAGSIVPEKGVGRGSDNYKAAVRSLTPENLYRRLAERSAGRKFCISQTCTGHTSQAMSTAVASDEY